MRGIGISWGEDDNSDDNDRRKGCISSLQLTRLELFMLSRISVGSTKIRIESCGGGRLRAMVKCLRSNMVSRIAMRKTACIGSLRYHTNFVE